MLILLHTRLVFATAVLFSVGYAMQATAEEPIFENVTEAAGVGGGGFVAWADYDGDGLVDLFVVNGANVGPVSSNETNAL